MSTVLLTNFASGRDGFYIPQNRDPNTLEARHVITRCFVRRIQRLSELDRLAPAGLHAGDLIRHRFATFHGENTLHERTHRAAESSTSKDISKTEPSGHALEALRPQQARSFAFVQLGQPALSKGLRTPDDPCDEVTLVVEARRLAKVIGDAPLLFWEVSRPRAFSVAGMSSGVGAGIIGTSGSQSVPIRRSSRTGPDARPSSSSVDGNACASLVGPAMVSCGDPLPEGS